MPLTKATPNVLSPISTTNTANSIVLRDATGNFVAGTITAELSGNSSTAAKLQTARTISLTGSVSGSASFDGSANVSITTTGGGGGGATGAGTDAIFWQNGQTVNTSYSIPVGVNAGSFGPITIAAGAVVTVPTGGVWTVV